MTSFESKWGHGGQVVITTFIEGVCVTKTAIYPGYHIATQQHSVRNSVLCNEIVHIGGRNLFKSSSGSIRLYQSDEMWL